MIEVGRSLIIVLAATHARYDAIEHSLRKGGCLVYRVRNKEQLTQQFLAELHPDWIFAPHWSWKIPPEIFENYRCVIFHMTDLPFGRGGSPLQNLIASGLVETRISALSCVSEMDAGPVYLKKPLSLLGTAEEILMRAAGLILEMIEEIVTTEIEPTPQMGKPTYFKRRVPADSDIQHLSELNQVYDFIRMLDGDGYPQAFLETQYFRLEFSRSSIKPDCILADVKITKKSI